MTLKERLSRPFVTPLMLGAVLLFGLSGTAEAQSVPGFTVTSFATDIAGARGVSTDSQGNVYTLGRDTGELWRISPTGTKSLVAKVGPDVGAGYVGPYFDPASGTLFVSEHNAGNNVLQISVGGAVSIFATGLPLAADITSDGDGNIYVANSSPGSVFKYSAQGALLGTYISGLDYPDGLVFGSGGELFVGHRGGSEILRVPSGGGSATSIATVALPLGVTVDREGNIYAAGFSNGILYKVSPSGGPALQIGSGFSGPVGLAFDPSGNLYVAEFFGNRVVKIAGVAPPAANRAPDVSAAAPSIASIWPPNNKMVPITINGVTDPDGDAVTITITAITNTETGSSDAGGIGTSTAQVRASRNGKGSGRTYYITFTASDGQATSEPKTVTVVVPHDQGKRAKPTAVESATWGQVKSAEW